MTSMPSDFLLVASYNIHRGIGPRGDQSTERIAGVIEEIAPDVIALQEVDSRLDAESPPGQLDRLKERLELECVSGVTLRREDAAYGNAVLSRLPVREVRQHDISVEEREPRGVIDLDLEYSGRTIRLLATHLGLRAGERRQQVGRLCGILDASDDTPLLLVGDFNDWTFRSAALRSLTRRFGRRSTPRTFPVPRPLLRLDRIWAHPDQWNVERLWAHRTPLAKRASDHLPLCAHLRLRS